jgi:hypothetical protein
MMPAVVPGTVVWAVLAGSVVVWLAVLAFAAGRGRLVGPLRVVQWFLSSWLSRGLILAAWGAAGWHIFCQRP